MCMFPFLLNRCVVVELLTILDSLGQEPHLEVLVLPWGLFFRQAHLARSPSDHATQGPVMLTGTLL